MFKYAKATKSCFTHDKLSNKKTVYNTINKNKIDDKNNNNNKLNVKNFQAGLESTKKLINKVKPIQNSSICLKNNKKKINDYFNVLVKDNSDLNSFYKIKDTKEELIIPDSLKKNNTIFPPINYNIQKINHKKLLKKKQLKLADDDGKIVLKNKGLSNNELKKYLVLIYDDIMIDDFENNQEKIDKTKNPDIKIKTKNSNKNFYNNFINEINICYKENENNKELEINSYDHKDDIDNICQLKKINKQNKAINKILDEIYTLNINDTLTKCPKLNSTENSVNSKKSNISSKKTLIQKTLLSTLYSPINTTNKTHKRKCSINNNKTNIKQTKLTFPKKQKKII